MPDEHASVRAPLRKRTTVTIAKVKRREEPEIPRRSLPPHPGRRPPAWGPIRTTFRHLGASLNIRPRTSWTPDPGGDVVNEWLTDTFPAGPFPRPIEVAAYADEMRRRAGVPEPPIRYANSGRELPGFGYPVGAVDLVSGWNMALTLARARAPGEADDAVRPIRSYGVQHNAAYVAAQRTADEQLEYWDSLEETFANSIDRNAHAEWSRRRREIERLKQERFDSRSGRFALKDLTLISEGLAPGLYVPSFSAGDQFFAWSPEDHTTYRTEVVRGDARMDVDTPKLATGAQSATLVDAMLVPRRHEYLFAWTAVYVNIILFTPPVYTTEVNIGVYSDILPMDWAFVGAEDDVRNANAISTRISRSPRYAVSINQDVGSQIFSPYFFKILVGRDDGQWAIREGVKTAGDPCAFLDVYRGDRDPDRYEITRKTTVQGGDRLNYSILFTEEVNPYDLSGIAKWSGSLPYGNL